MRKNATIFLGLGLIFGYFTAQLLPLDLKKEELIEGNKLFTEKINNISPSLSKRTIEEDRQYVTTDPFKLFRNIVVSLKPNNLVEDQNDEKNKLDKLYSADLDSDGYLEYLYFPGYYEGVSGTGIFYILQQNINGWTLIGELFGSSFVVNKVIINGYKTISMSYVLGPNTYTETYQFDPNEKEFVSLSAKVE
jgi:hypothetical protein